VRAIVLLSGGLDSTVALYWAINNSRYDRVDALTIDYGQIARAELRAVEEIWFNICVDVRYSPAGRGHHKFIGLPRATMASKASITGDAQVNQYSSVKEAVDNTASDTSYLPLRNAVFAALAANHLLVDSPQGGDIVMGTRGRSGPGGFPDCTPQFAMSMTFALSESSGVHVRIVDPLNIEAPTRARTIQLARSFPGCFEVLRFTSSCFYGTRCGKCLPCLRRAEAFSSLGLRDPAIG
jgi:7-cyano-7-deazaguanine synthase